MSAMGFRIPYETRYLPLEQEGSRYKLVVMDPPWENASARRSRQYPTLAARELLRLPLPQLLRQVSPHYPLLVSHDDCIG